MDLIAELDSRKSYLKVSEFARMLSVSARQVYKLVEQHRLPALKIGTTVRLCPRAAAAWLRERTA
jgi:excisionase family DNA binding protein